MSRNLRTALIFGGFISLIGAAFYPIYFRPLMRPEEYRELPLTRRADLVLVTQPTPPVISTWGLRKIGSQADLGSNSAVRSFVTVDKGLNFSDPQHPQLIV